MTREPGGGVEEGGEEARAAMSAVRPLANFTEASLLKYDHGIKCTFRPLTPILTSVHIL